MNNESQHSRGSGLAKININFTGENPMTSSGTNLPLFGGSPKEESKYQGGSKLYGSNTNAVTGLQPKKSLQNTNSTSHLETHVTGNQMLPKVQYHPNLRQKQGRENTALIGLSTISQQQNHSQGIGLNSPNQSIIKPTQSKITISNMNFPNLDDEKSMSMSVQQQPSSLI